MSSLQVRYDRMSEGAIGLVGSDYYNRFKTANVDGKSPLEIVQIFDPVQVRQNLHMEISQVSGRFVAEYNSFVSNEIRHGLICNKYSISPNQKIEIQNELSACFHNFYLAFSCYEQERAKLISFANDNDLLENISGGMSAGAKGGAVAGALAGLVFGPVGSAIGSVVGGGIGGFIYGKKIQDEFNELAQSTINSLLMCNNYFNDGVNLFSNAYLKTFNLCYVELIESARREVFAMEEERRNKNRALKLIDVNKSENINHKIDEKSDEFDHKREKMRFVLMIVSIISLTVIAVALIVALVFLRSTN
jgi:hypothetical protein